MKRLLVLLLVLCAYHAKAATAWQLLWNDEFSGSANRPPDTFKWSYDLGDGSPSNPGWGNNEKDVYTSSTANVFQDGAGHLVIRALNSNGVWTSGRIKTQDKFTIAYGRIEARIKIPYAQGTWPAFWGLGANIAKR